MASVLSNIFNPGKNLISGNFRSLADPLKAAGDPDKKAAPAPGAPDLVAEYLRGVQADADTLPLRRMLDTASQLGYVVFDNKIMSPDEYQQRLDFENNKIAQAEASGDTGAANAARSMLASKTYDFRGTGDADLANTQLNQELAGADTSTQGYLDLEKKYGTQFADEARRQLQATDPTGFNLREQMASDLSNPSNSIESLLRNGPNAPTYQQVGDNQLPQYDRMTQADAPSLSSVGRGPRMDRLSRRDLPTMNGVQGQTFTDTGEAAAGRAALESQTFGDLAMAGQPDPALQRSAEQAARARGASSGNILGDASALQESLKVQLAQRDLDNQRRQSALSLLQSGQTTSDKGNALRQQQLEGDLASTGFNNTAAQQMFQNRTTQAGFNNDASQRGFDNSVTTANFNNAVAQQDFGNQANINQYNNSLSDQAFANAMAAVNQRNQAAQNTFGSQQSVNQNLIQGRQQDIANKQSFLGLQPVVSQAGQLNSLQQGASPFNPGNVQQGALTNPNAGQTGLEWAGQLFSAQNQLKAGLAAADAAKSAGKMQAAGAVGAAAATYAVPALIAL